MKIKMNLNADMAEGFGAWKIGDDSGILKIIGSANIACGFHAGDPLTIRRAFAFPLLRGIYHGTDLGRLDPARPEDRRALMAADHEDQFGPPVSDQHLDRHVALADRLWRDDPPELWDAAQRLLDLGEDRHSVLHTLLNAIREAGDDENDIAAALADLPPEEPG